MSNSSIFEVNIRNIFNVPIVLNGDLNEFCEEPYKGRALHPNEEITLFSRIPEGLKIRSTTLTKDSRPYQINLDLVDKHF